jgi:hypothetical protein
MESYKDPVDVFIDTIKESLFERQTKFYAELERRRAASLIKKEEKSQTKKETNTIDALLEREMLIKKDSSISTIDTLDSNEDLSGIVCFTIAPQIQKVLKKKLQVAPDGVVPNSKASKEVFVWLKAHGKLPKDGMGGFPKNKKKNSSTKKKKERDELKDQKRKQYRDKLKEKINQMIAKEEEEQAPPIPIEEIEPEQIPEIQKVTLDTDTVTPNTFEVELAPISVEIIEEILPVTLEKLMPFEWVDFNDFFHPEDRVEPNSQQKVIYKTSTGFDCRTPVSKLFIAESTRLARYYISSRS